MWVHRPLAALVWADRGGWPYGPLWRTANWGYLRLHYGDAHVPPNYHRHTLRAWAERIAAQYGDHEDFFVPDRWRLQTIEREHTNAVLEPLVAAGEQRAF